MQDDASGGCAVIYNVALAGQSHAGRCDIDDLGPVDRKADIVRANAVESAIGIAGEGNRRRRCAPDGELRLRGRLVEDDGVGERRAVWRYLEVEIVVAGKAD